MTVQIIPAVDIKGGRCVRLTQGDPSLETVYSHAPESMALLWESRGARRLHVVDLDGAFEGRPVNIEAIEKIVSSVKIPVQVGGGYRDLDSLKMAFDLGASFAILGSKAAADQEFLRQAVETFQEKIILSIDIKEGGIVVDGWTSRARIEPTDLGRKAGQIGVKTIIVTDVNRDGTLQGFRSGSLEPFLDMGLGIIAAGGISTVDDLKKLEEIQDRGVIGAIVGKALYAGTIKFEEALAALGKPIFRDRG